MSTPPYDYAAAMAKLRQMQKDSFRPDVKGRHDRLILDTNMWTPARFIPGRYPTQIWKNAAQSETIELPFHRTGVHFWPKNNRVQHHEFIYCGRGLNDFAAYEMCPACLVPDHDGVMARFVYSVLGLHYYHGEKVPSKRTPGRTYTNWRQCQATPTNQNCPYCNKSIERVLGYLQYFEAGKQDQDEIDKLADSVGEHCACGGTISVCRAVCNACQQVIADVKTSGLSDADFRRVLQGGICPRCGAINKYGFQPVFQCSNCATPRPLTIFDVDVQMRRPKKPDGKAGTLEIQLMPNATGGISTGALHPEYAKSLAARGTTLGPLDLPAICAPFPPAKLAQMIKRHFGFSPVGGVEDSNAVPRGLPPAAGYGTPAAPPAPAPLPPVFGGAPAAPPAAPAPAPMPSFQLPAAQPPMAAPAPNPMLAALQHQMPALPPPVPVGASSDDGEPEGGSEGEFPDDLE